MSLLHKAAAVYSTSTELQVDSLSASFLLITQPGCAKYPKLRLVCAGLHVISPPWANDCNCSCEIASFVFLLNAWIRNGVPGYY